MTKSPVLALTPGEPAGIGPDLCIMLAQQPPPCRLVLIADPEMLQARAALLDMPFAYQLWKDGESSAGPIAIRPVPTARRVQPGRLDPTNAAYVIETLALAADSCLSGEFDALVTAPVHKGVINEAGIRFSGHTEFFAERAGVDQAVMMLADEQLRVALATTHLPLAKVSQHITQEHLARVIRVLHRDLQHKFGIEHPTILVCGLNPHAGESGNFGCEEVETIAPVMDKLRTEGVRLRGPVAADTAFTPGQLRGADAVLAMYHDQGLPVLKHRGFGHAVNITLGLPFIRTSVDHGTAIELAGTGRADATSLRAAVDTALALASK